MNGTLYARDSLPPDLAIRFGTSLGISPVCYPRGHLLVDQHVAVLERAAAALGYSGFDDDVVRDAIAASDSSGSIVALVPTPVDHKAGAPGPDWATVAEPFVGPDASAALRLCVSDHRRNHHSPTATALLLGDAELRAGTREAAAQGRDDVVWLNLDDAVSCLGTGALVAEIVGRVVTPPLVEGVPDSAWRVALVEQGVAVERPISVDELRGATSVAAIWPWGVAQAVAQIDDITYADPSLAPRVTAVLAAAAGRP